MHIVAAILVHYISRLGFLIISATNVVPSESLYLTAGLYDSVSQMKTIKVCNDVKPKVTW